MNIPTEKWYEAIKVRRSRRQFNGMPLPKDVVDRLNSFIMELNNSVAGTRAVLVTHNPEQVFKGIVGSYGKIKNPPAYVAFIGDMSDPNVQEKTGYLGECVILEATSLGLATCWVGGFFKPETVKEQIGMDRGQKVLAVSPVGYTENDYNFEEKMMSGLAASRKRKDLMDLCKGIPEAQWLGWIKAALEAARLAPSAVNRQPWRFTVKEDFITISVDNPNLNLGISKRLDCGIAMLHLEVVALHHGIQGKWEYLNSPDVAKFVFTLQI